MENKKDKKINIKSKKVKKTKNERTNAPNVWNPVDLMDAMDRWFWEDPWTPFWHRHRRGSLSPRESMYDRWLDTNTKISTIDMIDTGTGYNIKAEMPGLKKDDIEVNITEKNISICGEKRSETKGKEEGYIRRERSYSTICRTMLFPEEVNPEKADASLKDGILEINVSKKTPSSKKGKNIPIK